MTEVLTVKDHNGVRLLTLNRPDRRNALDGALIGSLRAAVIDGEADGSIGAMVLTGAPPAFCAGLDLQATTAPDWDPDGWAATFRTVRDTTTPIIAAVNGVASTAGLGLVVACDFALASSAATFVDMHARIKVMSASGMAAELVDRIGSARAKQMWLTATAIDAQRALDWGLVNEVVESQSLLSVVTERAEQITGLDAAYISSLLITHNRGRAESLRGHRDEEAQGATRWNAAQRP